MSNSYLDPYDRDNPPHLAGAKDGTIVEVDDRDQWSPGQRLFADWFEANAVDGLVPADAPVDALGPLFGFIHKLLVDRERDDFRYLIYGRSIAKKANMGMDGQWVSELPAPAGPVFLNHYRGLVRNPRLFVGRLTYVGLDMPYREWVRAVAPLGSAATGATHFIVFTETVADPRRI